MHIHQVLPYIAEIYTLFLVLLPNIQGDIFEICTMESLNEMGNGPLGLHQDDFFKDYKCTLYFVIPQKTIIFEEFCQWAGYGTVVIDKFTVIPDKPQ